MLFNKIKKTFNVQTVVLALDFRPLLISKPPYEESYPFWQLFYVSRGEMSIERNGERETIRSGEIIFRPPGKSSTMYYPEGCELYMSLIDFISSDEEMNIFGDKPIALDGKERQLLSELIREAATFYKNTPTEPLWQELVSSALESFLTRLYGRLTGTFSSEGEGSKASTRRQISETVDRINLILEERRFSTITVDELANLLGESPNVLMKRYRREMHESIIEHFLTLKLQSAIQLMLSSDMNFTEISELLSFSSVNYFSKFFKKRTGLTPTEYSKEYGLR